MGNKRWWSGRREKLREEVLTGLTRRRRVGWKNGTTATAGLSRRSRRASWEVARRRQRDWRRRQRDDKGRDDHGVNVEALMKGGVAACKGRELEDGDERWKQEIGAMWSSCRVRITNINDSRRIKKEGTQDDLFEERERAGTELMGSNGGVRRERRGNMLEDGLKRLSSSAKHLAGEIVSGVKNAIFFAEMRGASGEIEIRRVRGKLGSMREGKNSYNLTPASKYFQKESRAREIAVPPAHGEQQKDLGVPFGGGTRMIRKAATENLQGNNKDNGEIELRKVGNGYEKESESQ
ncbi:hypothetical protein B0H13DRAFT_2268658 [Mycena leptocephala]|nr:hypothetical protein B0H13DRAFT_2268658 [Mycena leptocephala]